MEKKVRVCDGYKRNGKTFHDVTIKGETFKVVPNLPKCEKCTDDSCKYYCNCIGHNGGVVRIFDCDKNSIRINRIWNILTGLLVVFLAFSYYKTLDLGFLKGTAAILASLVVLDIICCGVERLAVTIKDNYFYRKLKKRDEKAKAEEERQRLENENKRIQAQLEADEKDPNRVKIREAESTLKQIAHISKEIDFGECDEEVEFCVDKCREIIDHLKNDSSGYIRVETLLQVYLPEFYRILAFYAEFENAEAVEDTQKTKLNETVKYFYDFLCKQKVEAIFDKKATEIKFYAAADTLKNELEKRGGKL